MSTDDFTSAAHAEAERVHYPSPSSRTPSALNRATAAAFRDGASWARTYLTERCTACGEDPSGPLRPLTTDERSYQYAQDLGYELPEDPR